MKKLLLTGVALVFAAGMAVAGPNAGGAILVHVDESALTFCEIGGEGPDNSAYLPETCEELNTRTDIQGDALSSSVSWAVVAAFPPSASPDVKAAEFGIDYANIDLLGNWNCGDFVIESPTWPAPMSGVGMVFDDARTTTMVELFTFVGYSYTGNPAGYFTIVPHPSQGGPNFGDTSSPAVVDPVAPEMLGVLGFLQDGFLPCPDDVEPPVPGACCVGEFNEICTITLEEDCEGLWLGDESCEPNPCPITPTLEGSWGSIKANYR